MDFLQAVLIQCAIAIPLTLIVGLRKGKQRLENAVIENMKNAHKNLPLDHDILWIKNISREELRCPLTHEQIEEIEKCDSVAAYDVNIHVMKSSVLLHKTGYVYMTVSINFLGRQRANQKDVKIKIDGARVMANIEMGDPGKMLMSLKKV